ncbi:unnamed protein product [Tuwongella immobilis]|uniref:Uncharacterized protein n=1 Tax=Tuwongella immobilis TaxID=692036 RepID=A0A6C2YIB0_9BACT|nr:unnamed protein product [Tuwongella immobilis]VTR97633.1 unnamed protein product [Tuwongella immobilis]
MVPASPRLLRGTVRSTPPRISGLKAMDSASIVVPHGISLNTEVLAIQSVMYNERVNRWIKLK